MYSHGPHIDVTDLELSPIVGMWSDIFQILNLFSGPWADLQNLYLEQASYLRLWGLTGLSATQKAWDMSVSEYRFSP